MCPNLKIFSVLSCSSVRSSTAWIFRWVGILQNLKQCFCSSYFFFFNIYLFCFWIKWERFYTSINNHSWSEECDWWGRDLCLNNRKLTFHTDHIKCAVVWVYNCLFCSLQASSPFGGYHEKYMREWHATGDAATGGGGEKGELATISHKFSFPLQKPQDSVKCENCHHKHAAN